MYQLVCVREKSQNDLRKRRYSVERENMTDRNRDRDRKLEKKERAITYWVTGAFTDISSEILTLIKRDLHIAHLYLSLTVINLLWTSAQVLHAEAVLENQPVCRISVSHVYNLSNLLNPCYLRAQSYLLHFLGYKFTFVFLSDSFVSVLPLPTNTVTSDS